MLGGEEPRWVITHSSISNLASVVHCKLLKPKHMFIYPTEAQSPHVAVTGGTEKNPQICRKSVTSISMAGLGTHSSRE